MLFVVAQTLLLASLLVTLLKGSDHRLFPEHVFLTAVALVLFVAALVLAAAAFRSLRGAFQVAPAPKQGAQLVTQGVYSRLRHPMYTAVVSMVCAVALQRPSWAVLLCTVLIIVFYLVKSRYEERLLAQRYAEYPAYKARSKGVIPIF